MARKKFEETEYDPFEKERLRSLSRQVASPRTSEPPVVQEGAVASDSSPTVSNVVTIPKKQQKEATPVEPFKIAHGSSKSRTFKCSSGAQDRELDSFLGRLKDTAGTDIPFQVVARAAIAATMRAEEQIAEVIRKKPAMRRPANVSAAEYALFEQYWADIIMEALRKVRPYQS